MRCGVSSVTANPDEVLDRVLACPPMRGADLSAEVTTPQPYSVPAIGVHRFTVAALDYGIKAMTPHRLAERGITTHVLPSTSSASEVRATGADAVFLANGPGDPATADVAVASVRQLLADGLPVFDRASGKVEITAHNHGFAVDAPVDRCASTDFGEVEVSHVALNDGVVEGLRARELPAFSVQYHPEAAAGPHDAGYLFDRFAELLHLRKRGSA